MTILVQVIGKKYARMDEIVVINIITLDFSDTITLRDRDTHQQTRFDNIDLLVKQIDNPATII